MSAVPMPRRNEQTKKQRLETLRGALKQERASFEAHWRELGEYFRPRRTRFFPGDRNKGDKRSQKIIDSTAVFAARTLSSGMMSGVTSPARQWFKLTLADKALAANEAVKQWLDEVREIMAAGLARSNFYSELPTFYSDLGVFGTAVMIVEEDDIKGIRCTHLPIGEYCIGNNDRGQVRVFLREFQMTVRQIVEKFGKYANNQLQGDNLSDAVQTAWANGQTEQWIDVVHFIVENTDYKPARLESKHKRFLSCYYERGAAVGDDTKVLDEAGFDEFPVMAVRWEKCAGDVYATDCPGMTALGDNKALQFGRKLGDQALEKMVKPPMVAPTTMRNSALSQLPGGVSYVDETTDKKFRPAIDTSGFRLDYLSVWLNDMREHIKRAFFEDLFLLISSIDRGDVTATEILEKKEEKLLALGPVLEQVNEGFLDPFFDRYFAILMRRGELPEPPPELEGHEFHVEYESIMAQAQRAQGRSGLQSFAQFAAEVANVDKAVLDVVDTDELVQQFGSMAGVPPKLIRGDDEVAAIRESRAKAAQAQAAAEQAATMATAANKLGNTPTAGKNALTDLLGSDGSNVLSAAPGPQGGL